MENKSHALAAGLFVLVMAAMLAGLAMWLTRDSGSYHSYEMSTKEGVSGLQPQATVRYKGVSVGKVTYIGFDPQVSGNVLIRIAVEDSTPLTQTTFATLNYQGVTGLAYVLLDDAGEPQAQLPPGDSGLPRLPLRSSPFSQLADQGPQILGQVQEVTRRMNQLLDEDNRKVFSATMQNIGDAAADVSALARRLDATVEQRLDPALAALPPLARDTTAALKSLQAAGTQVAGVASEVGSTVKRLNAPGGVIDQAGESTKTLARAADRLSTSTLPRLERAAEQTGNAARQFGRVAGSLSDNPQALLYGPGRAAPGPGEDGFAAPAPASERPAR
ncbi:MAG: MCE family protein [Giesbergeria sp.]|nr:MCE family protein [Giesbergeria sp.]MBP8091841.1 MCE family protein [Giesbergeria sp.]